MLQDLVFVAVPRYIGALREVGATPPFFVMISALGVAGSMVLSARRLDMFFDPPPELRVDNLSLPVCVIEDFGTAADYQWALKPALDALWNAAGMSHWVREQA
jgi:hypothetical protein